MSDLFQEMLQATQRVAGHSLKLGMDLGKRERDEALDALQELYLLNNALAHERARTVLKRYGRL